MSEVMLQQTQVARVVPYYEAFLERFRDARALADAPLGDVLVAWSGLGYNRRALRLKAAAEVVTRQGWPVSATGLEALPGVGRYTAAAVASFAWDEAVPAVDTNAARVVARWDAEPRGLRDTERRLAELLPEGRAASFNHALMDLGATICGARVARCEVCPIVACRSRGAAPSAAPRSDPSPQARFETTDRFLRGRVVAALAAGDPLPAGLDTPRGARVVAGLADDGLVVREGGELRLP